MGHSSCSPDCSPDQPPGRGSPRYRSTAILVWIQRRKSRVDRPIAAPALGPSGRPAAWRLRELHLASASDRRKLHPTSVLGRTLISEAELLRLVAEATMARSRSPQVPIERDDEADSAPVQTEQKRPRVEFCQITESITFVTI